MVSFRSSWSGWKSPRSLLLILVLWRTNINIWRDDIFLRLAALFWCHRTVCCRGCGEQWTSGKISPWAGNQILCQGGMFMLTYSGHTLEAVFLVLITVSSFQILMPLINQYFKNHCLYFLSTPAKVLGSGGHSSNKEKEMIARWALQLRRCNWQLWHMFSILLLHLFSYYLSTFSCFVFLFPFHRSIFCKMSALVRHRVSLFGKTLVSIWIISLFSVTPLPYVTIWYYPLLCQAVQVHLVLSAYRSKSHLSCRNGCLSNCKLSAHSGTVPGCKVQYLLWHFLPK